MDVIYNMINIINTTVCYMTFKGENPEFSSQGEKKICIFFYSFNFESTWDDEYSLHFSW